MNSVLLDGRMVGQMADCWEGHMAELTGGGQADERSGGLLV